MIVEVKKKGQTYYQSNDPAFMPDDERVMEMRQAEYVTYLNGKVYNPSRRKKGNEK